MGQFSTALSQVLERSFEGKQMAMAAQAKMQTSDISRLVSEEAPLNPKKLEKLMSACNPADRSLLIHAAVSDFVGETEYKARFAPKTNSDILTDSLGGPVFHSLFPLNPRAEQVLRYLIHKAGSDPDVVQILELAGKFLELPPPENFGSGEEAPIKKSGVTYKAG